MAKSNTVQIVNVGKRTFFLNDGESLKPNMVKSLPVKEAEKLLKGYSREIKKASDSFVDSNNEVKEELLKEKKAHEVTKKELEEVKEQLEKANKDLDDLTQ